MIKALYWEVEADQRVRCHLCPHHCRIPEGRRGICQIRENREGILYALTYNRVSSVHMDPIEKKPLYHFFPGRDILSIGSVGCNLKCAFCQNWEISQIGFENSLTVMDPKKIVALAQSQQSIGVAYTYNEPFIWWEYVRDTSRAVRDTHLKNVLVTNGYIESDPLREILPLIDAMNIDLKAMDEHFYRSICGGSLAPVLQTIETSYQHGVHIEVTNLLVTGLNDSRDQIHKLVDYIAGLSPDIPLHFSRYFPAYRLEAPPTNLTILKEAYAIAREKLHYVYLGNMGSAEGQMSYCSQCGQPVIHRYGYQVELDGFLNGYCRYCGTFFPLRNE